MIDPRGDRVGEREQREGTVVTYTQNSRPVFGHVRRGRFIHDGMITRASYNPAPNAMPRFMTKSHNRMVVTCCAIVPSSDRTCDNRK